MQPGKVGETFEIFTTPSMRWWSSGASGPQDSQAVISSSPTQVHKIEKNWRVSNVLNRKLSFGKGGKRESIRAFEGRIMNLFRRTKGYIANVFGL